MDKAIPQGAGLILEMDEEGKALLASVIPQAGSRPIDATWLTRHLAGSGYGGLCYLPTAVTQLISQYNSGRSVTALRLAECVDARLEIRISQDDMAATLDITPAQGGAPITKNQILAALAEKGVTDGILLDEVNQAIAAGHATALTIARGTPPVHGKDGYFESLIPDMRARVPQENKAGQIDYRDLGEIMVVRAKDPLMLRHRATTGTPGITVQGVPVAPRPGKEVMYAPQLTGAAPSPDNPDLLLATQTGQPVVVKNGVIVEPVFTVPAVNMASGNIDFDGSVVIKGDVCAGMTVKVSGDIEVGGVVENAHLEAGGSIVIRGGVLGSIDQKGGSDYTLRCGHDFHAAYAQKARIEAGNNIFINDMAMQCELTAGQHIKVGKARRGHIVGGRIQAMLSITARVLGAPNRITTACHIGVNPSLQKEAKALAEQRDAQETQLLEISKLLDFAGHNPGRLGPEVIDKARHTALSLSGEIARLREAEKDLADKIALAQEARVTAEETLHEGVEVLFGTQRYRVVGDHGAGQIQMGANGLELTPLEARS
ncbi:MAG: FapA family protein [Azovibrio sp.]|uniref:DUF342 domain-containing protein n=1 Tax=Azovibrio sp. TaxID=1872673 RepID=UPI003C72E085